MLLSNMAHPLVIGCSVTKTYVPGLLGLLTSLLRHLPQRDAYVYVLHHDLEADLQRRIVRLFDDKRLRLRFLRQDKAGVSHLPHHGKDPAIYFRLQLPALLPYFEKILYLDCDLLLCTDPSELYDMDIRDVAIAAVQDAGVPTVSSRPWGIADYREAGLAPETPYFNSGVMLLNTKHWREEQIAKQVMDFTQAHRNTVKLWDQDGLNAVLAGKWKAVDPAWNCIVESLSGLGVRPSGDGGRLQMYELFCQPKILHFAGQKPWQKDCTHPRAGLFTLHTPTLA
jgi:lipopolysaccharide biosynthesis glycosyltransferase